jgi:hypothetical protein
MTCRADFNERARSQKVSDFSPDEWQGIGHAGHPFLTDDVPSNRSLPVDLDVFFAAAIGD